MPVRPNYKIKDCAKTFSLRRDIDMKINRTDTGDILLKTNSGIEQTKF